MSDHDDESAAVLWQSSTLQIILMSTMMMMSLDVLFVTPASNGPELAAATVGFVLAEALMLYVGYGALARIASPSARELLTRA